MSRYRALPAVAGAAAVIVGAIVAFHYHRLGLTLTHYDARGHLVVARRVFDSITPGWQQFGAVWLPLPHLLNAVPVQIDALYRTGASGVALSILSFGLATGAITAIVLRATGSRTAALIGAAAYASNPNVLYLQSTPMTEPLLLGLMILAVALLIGWCEDGGRRWIVGLTFALACLTRYEAWPVTVAALTAAAWTRARRGEPPIQALRETGRIAVYPAVAVALFIVVSRVIVGEWVTASGFFVPENKALGQPVLALEEIGWGARALTGWTVITVAAIGLLFLFGRAITASARASSLVSLALLASAALPWAAFVKGHPFRIRYMVPLIGAEAIGVGIAAGAVPRIGLVTALVAAASLVHDVRPLSTLAPMVLEAQWDRPNIRDRQQVTKCLRARYDGDAIMASMGSLGHYMQEMSRDGFALKNFLHEGNGDIWLAAIQNPRRFAGWILIEEKAEGGDMLALIARKQPAFLDGYSRLCEAAGVALYQRVRMPTQEAEGPATAGRYAKGVRLKPDTTEDRR